MTNTRMMLLTLALTLNGCDGKPPVPPDAGVADLVQALNAGPARSGGRLRLRWVDGTDGSRMMMDTPARDLTLTTLHGEPVNCLYSDASYDAATNHYYCLPAFPHGTYYPTGATSLFLDNACTQRVFEGRARCYPPTLYAIYVDVNTPLCPTGRPAIARLAEVQLAFGTNLWGRQGGNGPCSPSGTTGNNRWYQIMGSPLPLAAFQEGTEGAE